MDHRAAGVDHGVVVGVEGLGDDDLVPIVQDAVEDDLQRLAAPGGNQDVALLKVHPQVVIILLDGVNEHRQSRRGSVLQHRKLEIPDRLKVLGGRLDIRLADVQVVDFLSRLLGRYGVGVELAHGGEAALFYLTGKFHNYSSFSAALRAASALFLFYLCPCRGGAFFSRERKEAKDRLRNYVP